MTNDLEAEYNNRTKIADFESIVAGWARDSASFLATRPHADMALQYGPTERQALDLFWPEGVTDPPVAMFIHGGYWQALDRSFCSHLACGLLAHGVAVAIPSYNLCPTIPLAELVEQLRRAAAFLHTRYRKPLLAIGHSAGGHLSAMLLATDWQARGLPENLVCAALPISGLFDLAPLISTSINTGLRLDQDEAHRLSPLFLPSPGWPIHAYVGGEEGPEFARQSRSIAKAWGGTSTSIANENHLTILAHLADPSSPMVRSALQLMTR